VTDSATEEGGENNAILAPTDEAAQASHDSASIPSPKARKKESKSTTKSQGKKAQKPAEEPVTSGSGPESPIIHPVSLNPSLAHRASSMEEQVDGSSKKDTEPSPVLPADAPPGEAAVEPEVAPKKKKKKKKRPDADSSLAPRKVKKKQEEAPAQTTALGDDSVVDGVRLPLANGTSSALVELGPLPASS